MKSKQEPFRYWIFDNFIPLSLCNAAVQQWPNEDWPYWHVYSDSKTRKLATKDVARLPDACKMIFNRVAGLDICDMTGEVDLFPDFDAHGAGMHYLPTGGRLGVHVDSEVHPIKRWVRRFSASLYLEDLGDESPLCFYDSTGENIVERIETKARRLVLFECSKIGYHGIPDPVVSSKGRKSISCFFWSPGTVDEGASSARFL